MLNGVKLKELYSKIQIQLSYMIPEKWDKIYLHMAMVENKNGKEKGEMFFYYYPTGILKKNPINVYEIPSKFNIDEEDYMKLVDKLYSTLKQIRDEFKEADEKLWNSLTISIENLKFEIEYDYEDLSDYTSDERHIIWQHKYLDLPTQKLSRKNKKMLEEYLLNQEYRNEQIKKHTENMYKMHVHNIVEYNMEEKNEEEERAKRMDKYELYKLQQEEKKAQKIEIEEKQEKAERKNQILNY